MSTGPILNYPEYDSGEYYTNSAGDIAVSPWITDTTADQYKYINPQPLYNPQPAVGEPSPLQALQLALMVRIQAILEPYQHTEINNELLADHEIEALLNTWKDAGILLTWSVDFKQNHPDQYTVYITYGHIFSYLSEHIAVPLIGLSSGAFGGEPLNDSDSKKRLKDLIL